jgi:hypothetical protein
MTNKVQQWLRDLVVFLSPSMQFSGWHLYYAMTASIQIIPNSSFSSNHTIQGEYGLSFWQRCKIEYKSQTYGLITVKNLAETASSEVRFQYTTQKVRMLWMDGIFF